jgi:hypothetical protein
MNISRIEIASGKRGRGKNPASRTTVLNVEKLTEIN